MSLFSTYKSDPSKAAKGFWFEDTGVINDDKTTPGFLLARAHTTNPAFSKAAEAVGKKFKRQLEQDIMTGDTARMLNRALFLDTVLLGWRNVFDENGILIQFSRENADILFEQLPDLYELLEIEAKKLSNFRAAEIDGDTKN